MRRALLAEWTKLRTVRSSVTTMLALPGLMAAGTALITTSTDMPGCTGDPKGCPPHDTTVLTLSGVHFAQLAAIVLATALVSMEFHPRTIWTTFAMNPRRATVFAAKSAVIGATVFATAAIGVAGAVLIGRVTLTNRGLTPDLGFRQLALADGALQRAALGTVLYLVLVALLGVGVAATVRHTGASIGAMLTLLYGPYLVTLIVPMPAHTLHKIQDASPMTAGLAVQATISGTGTAPLAPWTGLAVLAAYTLTTLVLGGTLFTARDA
jgi:ABC-2 type transport system permease protein